MLALLASVAVFMPTPGAWFQRPEIPPPLPPTKGSINLGQDTFVDYTFELELLTEWNAWAYSRSTTCRNTCLGQKHLTHEQCDRSCDENCRELHQIDADAGYIPVYLTKLDDEAFWKALEKVGSPLAPTWKGKSLPNYNGYLDPLIEKILRNPDNTVHARLPHWNLAPCTASSKIARNYTYIVVAKWQIGRLDHGPDGKEIRVMGPTGKRELGVLTVYKFDKDQTPWSVEECRCKVVLTEDEAHYREELEQHEKEKEKAKTTKPEEPALPKDGHGMLIGPKDLDKLKVELICTDMNEIVIHAENPFSYPIDFCCDPGTICESDDDAYQDMVFILAFLLHLGPLESRTISMVPAHGPVALIGDGKEGKGRIACTEMHKREPNNKVKYHFATRYDMNLARLCAMTKDEFITSNVQPRIWVYTDHASYDDMAKVLFPRPTPGQYMDVCYDVARVGGAHFLDPEYAACVDPALLSGKGRVRPEAAQWYCGICEKADPEKLASSVSAHVDDFAALLGQGADERTVLRVAASLSRLSASDNAKVALAGARALTAVPQERRAEMMAGGALSGTCTMLSSKNPSVCAAAMDLIELYRYAPAYTFLVGLEAPTPELKARAADLGKKLLAPLETYAMPPRFAATIRP